MKTKAIIFDFFGVFVDDIYNVWSQDALPTDVAKQIRAEVMGKVDLEQIDRNSFFKLLSEASDISQEVVETQWQQLIIPNEAVVDLSKLLREKYVVVLCSNAATWEIDPILKQFEFAKLFDDMFISGEIQLTKPNADFFNLVLDALPAKPGETVFIDDNEENINAAEALGMPSILFEDAAKLKNALEIRSLI